MTDTRSQSALRQLRVVAILEGSSFVVLLFIAIPLKYMAGFPLAVRIVGGINGFLFVVFLLALARAAFEYRWPARRVLLALVASVVPFGMIPFDRSLRRDLRASRTELR